MKKILARPAIAVLIICLLAPTLLMGGIKDTAVSVPLIGFSASFNLPAADLADRYGPNSTAGVSFYYKTKSNWLIGGEYNYLFGSKVREQVLSNIYDDDGYIINAQGQYQPVRISLRGHLPLIKVGKIFPVVGPNPNSGITLLIGGGIIEHKIKYYFPNNSVAPQLDGEYYKGYDRLSNGLALSQGIGYFHLSNNKRINFNISFEIIEGFTQGRRDYQFDLMKKDDAKRLDIMYGLKVNWYIPLYRKSGEYYY